MRKKELFLLIISICIVIACVVTGCDQFSVGDDNKTSQERVADKTTDSQINICDWYGNYYPICEGISVGWGWENNESCIGLVSCEEFGGISLQFSDE